MKIISLDTNQYWETLNEIYMEQMYSSCNFYSSYNTKQVSRTNIIHHAACNLLQIDYIRSKSALGGSYY
jgi:hypothetical protein